MKKRGGNGRRREKNGGRVRTVKPLNITSGKNGKAIKDLEILNSARDSLIKIIAKGQNGALGKERLATLRVFLKRSGVKRPVENLFRDADALVKTLRMPGAEKREKYPGLEKDQKTLSTELTVFLSALHRAKKAKIWK